MSRKHWMIACGVAGVAALAAPALAAAQGRYHGLDRNRDGVITRAEWRGNATSFRQHDSNRDGVISGAEVRHVPAWDARNNRWERDQAGTTAKPKAKAKPAKSKTEKSKAATPKGKAVTPKAKAAKPAKTKPKGGHGHIGH